MIAAIVIPVYKEQPTVNEMRSLRQCLLILAKYPVILVAPQNLNLSRYEEIAGCPLLSIRFDDDYFISVNSYSRLLLSRKFYKPFSQYQYILLYQLDAWVFRDELQEWIEKDYDYVGAPWLHPPPLPVGMKPIVNLSKCLTKKVGNGGLSLRKVSSLLRWCLLQQFIFYFLPKNEDMLWTLFAPFKKPSFHEALQFAFELNPTESFALNNQQLPFGCHAWEKYEPFFWAAYIP